MDYPIYIHHKDAGTLRVEQQGLYTRFSARFPDPGELIRLCVFGEGRSALLGVAMPEGGELVLERSFSRAALRDFPTDIEYAAPAGETLPEPEPESAAEPTLNMEPHTEPTAEPELIWYSRADGSLTTLWQGHSYVAVPLELCSAERESMLEQRRIEGREYAVFEGRSVE